MTRMNQTQAGPGFTPLGKIVSFLLIVGLIAVGAWVVLKKSGKKPPRPGDVAVNPVPPVATADGPAAREGQNGGAGTVQPPDAATGNEAPAELAETQTEVPRLDPAAPYQLRGDTVDIELSEYAGYAGLIVANGGLDPNANSVFAKDHGFKVRIAMSEESSWSQLNSGKMAASATTADVLAVYGRQFNVVVPAQIGFSRGADGVVVRREIERVNALKGQILAAEQFTETDFFIRYLAQEAGLAVNMLASWDAQPDPEKVNLVYASDAFAAGDMFLNELKSGGRRLGGCVTWAPKTTEVVDESGGRAHMLTTNKNLLIVADILIVNKGFAQQNPKIVAGLVDGLLKGNRMVRDNPDAHLDTIVKAFNRGKDPVADKEDMWDRASAKEELAKVHLSNLPENLAFFTGAIDAAGSFGGIYGSAVYAYGKELIPNPQDAERFVDITHLQAAEKSGAFKDQQIAIAPISTGGAQTASVEANPLLSKDIRFFFRENSHELNVDDPQNLEKLASIKDLLQVSPGSIVLLRGHVDNALVEEFRQQGGDAFVRRMALKAMELSKNRAAEIRRLLIERYNVSPERLESSGRGWEEPAGTDSAQNRRVEVQWFLVE